MAKKKYRKFALLFDCGLMVSPHLPFLAVSSDGIAYDGEDWKLVEIKCPVKGKLYTAQVVMYTLSYIEHDDKNNFQLKIKHAYYSEIQLGLAITDLQYCDFIIYSSFDDTFEVIKVHRDYNFIDVLIKTLLNIYFDYVLPFIFK